MDVGFTAASSHTLDCIICRFLTFDLAALTGRVQPIAGAHLGEVIAAKLPVDTWLPMAGLEEADHEELLPLRACLSPPAFAEPVTQIERQYMNAPYAKPSIRFDSKVKIAPVHSDSWCDFGSRSLMGFAGWILNRSVALRCAPTFSGFSNHGLTCLAITS